MLLYNGNMYPSLPLAHSAHLKEEYTSIKTLLDALKYVDYGWEVIGDFKNGGIPDGSQRARGVYSGVSRILRRGVFRALELFL